MKKIVMLLSACMLISFMGYTQKVTPDKVPAAVLQAFTKKFPAATDVKYELKNNNYYITFRDKGVREFANYNPGGNWLETKTAIIESELPKEVTAAIAKDFAGFKISEVNTVETPDNPLFYMMDLKKGTEGYMVHFSAKGDVLKKTLLKTPLKK
jgi:hypothetical protein